MPILALIPLHPFALIALCGLGFIVMIATYVVLYRFVEGITQKLSVRRLSTAPETILSLLESQAWQIQMPHIRHSTVLRDGILHLASSFAGDLSEKLLILYNHLGFLKQDHSDLRSSNHGRVIAALSRCRTMRIPLSNQEWEALMSHPYQAVTWAAMEYIITMKGKQSLLWVLQFLHSRECPKGVALHLMSCIGKISPEVLPVVLEHCDGSKLQEILLRAMTAYPVASGGKAIVSVLQTNGELEVLIAGVKALAVNPIHTSEAVFHQLARNPSWVVRMLAAETLSLFDSAESLAILELLSLDMSYYVRQKAIASIANLPSRGASILETIANTPDHPSQNLCAELGFTRKTA